jgi:metal-responsive CopG/Arc/MetJ family transcriptional regulator
MSERVSVALPRSVMSQIDEWRRGMPVAPARSTAIRALVEMALANLHVGTPKPRQ